MEYRKFGNDFVLRIDKGEEILASLKALCEKEHILLGSVSGIGALSSVTLGVFDPREKRYFSEEYNGAFEIASCTGNISTKDGQNYLHIHMVAGNVHENKVFAGHLNKGVIGLTGEFMVHKIDGSVDRTFSEDIGLNLFEFRD